MVTKEVPVYYAPEVWGPLRPKLLAVKGLVRKSAEYAQIREGEFGAKAGRMRWMEEDNWFSKVLMSIISTMVVFWSAWEQPNARGEGCI